MTKTNIKMQRVFVLAVAIVMCGLFMISPLVRAQEQEQTTAPAGSGLRVSPTRTELELDPSDSSDVTHTVKNVTSSEVVVRPQLTDFESDGETGAPSLIGDPNVISEHSLRQFVTLPEEFNLKPDEEKEITIPLTVPDNVSPGAYFGSVVYRASPVGATGDGQVALIASVGSLILVEIKGDITEKISILSVGAYLEEKKSSLFTRKPDSIGVRIENLGNGFSKPFGPVSVKDWRGKEIFKYELNDVTPKNNILPGSIRLFTNELFNVETKVVNGEEQTTKTSPIKWPGRYTVSGNISHGSNGEIYTVSSTFWFLPTWLLIILALVFVALVVLVIFLYRRFALKGVKRK